MLKFIGRVIVVLNIMFLLWLSISYLEICCKNLSTEPIYSIWNLFNILMLI